MRKSRESLTYEQFYTACEALKSHKQEFMVLKMSCREASIKLSALTELPISVSTMAKLKVATGIEWKTPRGKPNLRGIPNRNHTRTLTIALHALYEQLGASPTHALEMLYKHFTVKPTAESEVGVNGVQTKE